MPRARKEKNQIAFCFSSFVYFAQTLFLLKKKSRILSAVPIWLKSVVPNNVHTVGA